MKIDFIETKLLKRDLLPALSYEVSVLKPLKMYLDLITLLKVRLLFYDPNT